MAKKSGGAMPSKKSAMHTPQMDDIHKGAMTKGSSRGKGKTKGK